jgi:hypothetical protein
MVDSRRDGRRDRRHFPNVDLLDRLRRIGGRRLDGADLVRDFLGRLGGLPASDFTSEATTAKPLPDFAGTRRLDRSAECEQV